MVSRPFLGLFQDHRNAEDYAAKIEGAWIARAFVRDPAPDHWKGGFKGGRALPSPQKSLILLALPRGLEPLFSP
jgi:hypothetical protein